MDAIKSYGQQAWNKSLTFLNSDGLIPQLVLTIVIVLVIHFIIVAVESFIKSIQQYNRLSATLLPYTYIGTSNGAGKQTIKQDNTFEDKEYPFMYPSENEVHGIEFSYSFHLYIDPRMYEGVADANEHELALIFYKGSKTSPWPLMSPGVFLHKKTNTIRIYMNSIDNFRDTFVEIPNVPVGKWFHMVITQKGQNMDVYINGNIAVRKTFTTIPKFNYGGVYVFHSPNIDTSTTNGNDTLHVKIKDSMEGMISRLKYYSYAISFSQIDSLLQEGPSKKIVSTSYDQSPPYLHDSWWVTRYNAASPKYGL